VNQLRSRDEAEDAVQSTFLNAHRALQRGVEPEAELAWLFKIAHNVCLTRRRSSRRRGRVESPSDLGAVQDVLPAPARESADELIRLTDALSHMPDNQRRAILLREWQGLSYHEIADELKLSQSAVETLIFRARRTLAANLEVEPERVSTLARARRILDIGSLLSAAKTILAAGTAVKATAAAVAVSGAVVVATAPTVQHHATPSAHAAAAPAVAQVQAPVTNVAEVQTFDAPTHSAAAPKSRVAAPIKHKHAKVAATTPAAEAPATQTAPTVAASRVQPPVPPAAESAPPAPAAQQPAQDHGNRGKDKEHGKPSDPPAAVSSQPQPSNPGNGNGHGNGRGNGKGKNKGAEPQAATPAPAPEVPVAAPAAATPTSVATSEPPAVTDDGNGNGKDKGDKGNGHNK
jgi:RNA polymerase sigma factor (sigma-70 family)